jgi:hypothetical protein
VAKILGTYFYVVGDGLLSWQLTGLNTEIKLYMGDMCKGIANTLKPAKKHRIYYVFFEKTTVFFSFSAYGIN